MSQRVLERERKKVKTEEGRLGAHTAEVQDTLVTFKACIGIKS